MTRERFACLLGYFLGPHSWLRSAGWNLSGRVPPLMDAFSAGHADPVDDLRLDLVRCVLSHHLQHMSGRTYRPEKKRRQLTAPTLTVNGVYSCTRSAVEVRCEKCNGLTHWLVNTNGRYAAWCGCGN